MSRLGYIFAALWLPACATSSSDVRSSPDRSASTPEFGAQPQPSDEEVPEWLKKKPPGDPSVAEFRARMAEEHRQFLRLFNDKAAKINFNDGIDVSEAQFIGSSYFTMKFGACGVTENATDGGAEWLIRPRVGVTGHPLSDFIRVDKRSGMVRYGAGPTTEAKEAIEYERSLLQKNVDRFSNHDAGRRAGEQGVGPDDRSPSAPAHRSTP